MKLRIGRDWHGATCVFQPNGKEFFLGDHMGETLYTADGTAPQAPAPAPNLTQSNHPWCKDKSLHVHVPPGYRQSSWNDPPEVQASTDAMNQKLQAAYDAGIQAVQQAPAMAPHGIGAGK
jgi:hypothetical protein